MPPALSEPALRSSGARVWRRGRGATDGAPALLEARCSATAPRAAALAITPLALLPPATVDRILREHLMSQAVIAKLYKPAPDQ